MRPRWLGWWGVGRRVERDECASGFRVELLIQVGFGRVW